jgi:hypothetical protein
MLRVKLTCQSFWWDLKDTNDLFLLFIVTLKNKISPSLIEDFELNLEKLKFFGTFDKFQYKLLSISIFGMCL